MPGFIYKNIHNYRFAMNLLYGLAYKKRFSRILALLADARPQTVTELCFGDLVIADFCRKQGIIWKGFDINQQFVDFAQQYGFDASRADLTEIAGLPVSDICIIAGSLYHFSSSIDHLFQTIFASSGKLIISEPVKNLSEVKGIVGWLARRISNAGKGTEDFRYQENTLTAMLDKQSKELHLSYEIVGYFKKDIIILVKKNETSY